MAKVKDFYGYLNSIAPFETQEDWDNSGMLVGDMNAEVKKAAVVLSRRNQKSQSNRCGPDNQPPPCHFHPYQIRNKGQRAI